MRTGSLLDARGRASQKRPDPQPAVWPRIVVGLVLLGGFGILVDQIAGDTTDFEPLNATEGSERAAELVSEDEDFTSHSAIGANTSVPSGRAVFGEGTFTAEAAFGEGTFVVGEEIRPGTYRADGGASCSWKRLSGFSGDSEDIIASGNGFSTVEIADSDTGFASTGCGSWLSTG